MGVGWVLVPLGDIQQALSLTFISGISSISKQQVGKHFSKYRGVPDYVGLLFTVVKNQRGSIFYFPNTLACPAPRTNSDQVYMTKQENQPEGYRLPPADR